MKSAVATVVADVVQSDSAGHTLLTVSLSCGGEVVEPGPDLVVLVVSCVVDASEALLRLASEVLMDLSSVTVGWVTGVVVESASNVETEVEIFVDGVVEPASVVVSNTAVRLAPVVVEPPTTGMLLEEV